MVRQSHRVTVFDGWFSFIGLKRDN